MSLESTAANLIQRGVMLDMQKRYTESLICYQEGAQMLFDASKNAPQEKKQYLIGKVKEYITRAEEIKENIEKLKEEGKYHEKITIENESNGHSYETVFGRFLDENVLNVKVEDPYIRSFHQCTNLVRFCELALKKCKNLNSISVMTTKDPNNGADQEKWLNELKTSLEKRNIKFTVDYSTTLHDREIILSSGWIIKIGRGLDYFKPPEAKFAVGSFDMDIRSCYETTIDIFHSNNVKEK